MTKIKCCGLTRLADIVAANELKPDYIGFVFWAKSRRALTPQQAALLKAALAPGIRAVGVFVDEAPETVAAIANAGTIDLVQLHGHEDAAYIARLRQRTDAGIIQAFRIRSAADVAAAQQSPADLILLDAGMGDGVTFDWSLLQGFPRPYLLAGGLTPQNVQQAVHDLRPWGVDVSTGIETNGKKDRNKMKAFIELVSYPR